MKRLLSLILAITVTSGLLAQKTNVKEIAEGKDYIVENKGDTIYGNVKMLIWNGKTGLHFKFEQAGKDQIKCNNENVKAFRKDGNRYERRLLKPEKNKPDNDLMEILMKKGTVTFYRYLDNGYFVYYIFDGDKFICYIERKNYQEILINYFGSCGNFATELSNGKFKDMDDTAKKYAQKCE